jgi:hypothetical protein
LITPITNAWAIAEMVKLWSPSKRLEILLVGVPALVCACVLIAGCYRSARRQIAPVHGQVTYQGRPVAGATVEFLCAGASRPAAGTTDEQGNYRLTTFSANDGAMVGTHAVTVNVYASQSEVTLPSVSGLDSKAKSKAIEDAARQSARLQQTAAKALPQIPKKYAAWKTSDLSKEVAAGDNTINIELSD